MSIALRTGAHLHYAPEDTEHMVRLYQEWQGIEFTGSVWRERREGMVVIACLEPTQAFGELLHVSASLKTRLPRWPEMAALKEAFYGEDIDAMMVLPAKVDYVNIHEHCLHLWQCPTTWGIR